ncbi:hypothetical protein CVIRNUC_010314 [Coccomyxa viridis]|uniref:SET domain-containing protein n=1 Tax=Coccomyxa viridis TaxID=1274662 RepID=A0AAV1IID4_9CHLO|nr:hypothetical protein CVIRNUC_010314 [Coccomyxa viridis]
MKRTGSLIRSWLVTALLVSHASYVAVAADAAIDGDSSEANEIQTEMLKDPSEIDSATKLLMWIQQNDGLVDCQVGEVNAEGLRGVRAQRDMQQHQVAVKLPKVMAITLKEWNKTSEENALWLLKKKAVNKDWNVIMGPYWESLPKQGTLNTKETFPRSSLSLLQDDSMAAFVRVHQDFTANVLRGGKPHITTDVRAELEGQELSLEEFKHWTALVASYAFTFPDEDKNDTQIRIMLPLFDLLNHGNPDKANMGIMRDEEGSYIAYALRPIKKGEELVHAYNKVCERNDQSLFHYGFIQDTDPPRLAALDLPSGNLYDAVAYNETDYEEGGRLATAEEKKRLEDLLASFPTTQPEDEKLIAGGGWMGSLLGQGKITGEVERMFVRFRILRKRALRYYIEKLARQLQGDKAEL